MPYNNCFESEPDSNLFLTRPSSSSTPAIVLIWSKYLHFITPVKPIKSKLSLSRIHLFFQKENQKADSSWTENITPYLQPAWSSFTLTCLRPVACLSIYIFIRWLDDGLHVKRADVIFTTYTVSKVVPLFSCPKLFTSSRMYRTHVCINLHFQCPGCQSKVSSYQLCINVLPFNLHEGASINLKY